jgi:hypothetical protein
MPPKSSRLERGGILLPTKVAPIFGPRYVAKLVRSTVALWGDGDPTPHQAGVWLLAIFRKLTATWHTRVFQQSSRANAEGNFGISKFSSGIPPAAPFLKTEYRRRPVRMAKVSWTQAGRALRRQPLLRNPRQLLRLGRLAGNQGVAGLRRQL